jgi:hypothetical protein
MEVFRRSEKRCVEVQERVVVEAYHDRRERDEGIDDLFRQGGDESFATFSMWRDDARAKAKAEFERWLKTGSSDRASHRRAVLMQHPHVDAALVNSWMREATKTSLLRREVHGSDEVWTPLVADEGTKRY